ncbi:MAG: hypothetical protein COB37_03155 [Kordiimonadales bacterium]|nr:MAG: hypothetical protein COB37_03155 [Kordiimonadales bacterium]
MVGLNQSKAHRQGSSALAQNEGSLLRATGAIRATVAYEPEHRPTGIENAGIKNVGCENAGL